MYLYKCPKQHAYRYPDVRSLCLYSVSFSHLKDVHYVMHIFFSTKGPNVSVLFSLPSPQRELGLSSFFFSSLLSNCSRTSSLECSVSANIVITAVHFILSKEGRLERPACRTQLHSRVFGVPVTASQFVQTCLRLSPVQRSKRELIAVTSSFFPHLPSGSFSCEVCCNKHVTGCDAVMTQTGPINHSGVILTHNSRNS